MVADVYEQVEHILLSLNRAECVDCVKGILLEEGEVYELGLPESLVVTHRNTVVAENVDLVGHLLAPADYILGLEDFVHPPLFDFFVEVGDDFRVLEVLGIRVYRVH